jgi:hypothetical protein
MSGNGMASRLLSRFESLNPRERTLLLVLAGILVPGLSAVLLYVRFGQLSELNRQNDLRRDVIAELLAERDQFAAAAAAEEALEEALDNNTLRLSSFVESRATELGVPVPNDFDDLNTPATGGIETIVTVAKFASMQLGDLDELLNDIESSPELVYIRGISVAPARGTSSRRGSSGAATPGSLQVELTLATFRRAESRGGDDD